VNITTATPAEIDSVLAPIEERIGSLFGDLLVQAKHRDEHEDGIAKAAAGNRVFSSYTQAGLDRVLAKIETIRAAIAEAKTEAAPLHAEFERRGGWTRAFLVLNNNGHLHSSTSCSTTYPTTRWGWLPQESGKTEAEIVEGAGSDACTVCYPSAPVETLSRPRRTLHATEVEAAAARAARDAEKAAKAAAKAAKAAADDLHATVTLVTPDAGWDYRGGISTIRKAKSFLTDGAEWKWDHPYYVAADRDAVAAALAARNGTTPADEIAAADKRAAKRR
jgi:hypothetical protein